MKVHSSVLVPELTGTAPLPVLEYCEGGEVRWKTEEGQPLMTLDQARRTLRDIVLGLEYRECQLARAKRAKI